MLKAFHFSRRRYSALTAFCFRSAVARRFSIRNWFSLAFFLIFSFPAFSFGQGFAPKVDYVTGTQPVSVFAVDLDGDTDNDLAVSPAVFAATTFAPKTANSILNAGGRADD